MEIARLFDLLELYKDKYSGKKDAFAAKEGGSWRLYSATEYVEIANNVSYGLLKMGFKKGDKIATVANNRPEWNFMDMGMMQVGVIHVPIYPTISDEEYKHILKHSDARILIVSDELLYHRLLPIAEDLGTIQKVYTYDRIEGAPHWSEIAELGKTAQDVMIRGNLVNIKQTIQPDDVATIIYTSGTTGLSKGVMLSHRNFVYLVLEIKKHLNLNIKSKALSFLPLCHVLERIGGYLYQYMGVGIYYAENIEKIGDNLKEIHPHIFVTVPRLLERVYDKIIQKGKDLEGVKKKLFFWSVDLGLDYELMGKNGFMYETKLSVANKIIFKKWRDALGGNIQCIISGGAALQPRLAKIFWAAGIPILEGYGLTETAPVIAVNRPDPVHVKFGTVGPLLGEEQQVKIAEDGEILFKGPNLMLGYYKDDAKTKETIDEEGWFHTGDIGEWVEGRFLKITDRKKEIFKLSTGKYIAPQVVENMLKESIFIDQVMVVGENEKFAGALIAPNFEFLHDWASRQHIHYRENRDLIEVPSVIERFEEEVQKTNKLLGQSDKIKRFQLVCEAWTADGGELSPTLKLKRKFIANKYKWRIEQIYERWVEK